MSRNLKTAMFLLLFAGWMMISALVSAEGSAELEQNRYPGSRELEVSSPDWDVRIIRAPDGDAVSIDGLSYDSGRYRVDISRRGDRLVVDIRSLRTWSVLGGSVPTLTVRIPSGTTLNISSASGDILVEDGLTGNARLNSASGDISLESFSGELSLNSSSGDLSISEARGNLSAGTSSGRIRIGSLDGYASLQSSSGDIIVQEGISRVEARTSSGDIRFDRFTVFEAGRFASVSGDISLELAGEIRDYRILAVSSSGRINLLGLRGEDELSRGEGPVLVQLASSSGDIVIR